MPRLPTFFCPKAWESMSGDETCRFCSHCQQEVHNLTALSPDERTALLESGAASICGRYRAAIRRPAPGREQAYWRHLATYGAGVAALGAATFVFWEAREHDRGPVDYLVGRFTGNAPAMPTSDYVEDEVVLLGMICPDDLPTQTVPVEVAAPTAAPHAPRFRLSREQVQALLPPVAPAPPSVQATGPGLPPAPPIGKMGQ